MSEYEFLSLKNEQSLIVSFQNFPEKLIELLELTRLTSAKQENLK